MKRRTLLRGALLSGTGATLGLPWMEAMAAAAAGKPPVRLAALYMPNGVNVEHWTPKSAGRDFELTPTLQPLAPFKSHLNVFSNFWNVLTVG